MASGGEHKRQRMASDGEHKPQRKLIGLVGENIIQFDFNVVIEKEFSKKGVQAFCQYVDVNVCGLNGKDIIQGAKLSGYDAFAVTHPSKEHVLAACDNLSPDCKAIGAVNTVTFDAKRKATGYNFDWTSAKAAMEEVLGKDAKVGSVAVLGAGGVSRAVVYALAQMGAEKAMLTDIDEGRAQKLIDDLASHTGSMKIEICKSGSIPAGVEGVVNCTPVGMDGGPHGMPVPEENLKDDGIKWVFDVVVNETELLRSAQALGKKPIAGRRMNVLCMKDIFSCMSGVPLKDLDDFLQ